MTAVEPPDDLPPVPAPAVHDMIVGLYGLLAEQPETVIIEQEAWDDPLPPLPPRGPCLYDGIHCRHWAYTADPCCHCGSVTDSEDARCHGRIR